MNLHTAPEFRGFLERFLDLCHGRTALAARTRLRCGAVVTAMSIWGAAASGEQTRLQPTDRPAPDFSLPDLRHNQLGPANFAGRTVLVHFFATWCEPCRAEFASLDRLAAELPDLAILAVDVGEPPSRLKKFLATNPVAFPVVIDADRAVTKAWGVVTLPTTVVLGPDLAPRLVAEGEIDWATPVVRARLLPARESPEPKVTRERTSP